MVIELRNQKLSFVMDTDSGIVSGLIFHDDEDAMNWLISPELLRRYGYSGIDGCLLGKSIITTSEDYDTGAMKPSSVIQDGSSVTFEYRLPELLVRHMFFLEEASLRWDVSVQNHTDRDVRINKMYHWMPVAYVMHETPEENCSQSCAFVPSVTGSRSYVICKKRSGNGQNLLVTNLGGGMRSTGSLCKYKNLFFEEHSPSLSGLVLYNTVNVYRNETVEKTPGSDWQYRDMYHSIILPGGETFNDSYRFFTCESGKEEQALKEAGVPYVEFPPVAYVGHPVPITVDYQHSVMGYTVYAANENGEWKEFCIEERFTSGTASFNVGPFSHSGERKLKINFEDGTSTFVVFAVYESVARIMEAFCHGIFKKRFIGDSASQEYCAYQSTSRQGESCAKGSLLLLKNLIAPSVVEEVQQVERNTVYYLRKRWLDENFIAIKQYPGGFARMFDLDFLILQFYLISLFNESMLTLNTPDTYLMWAYRTSVYSMEITPDKSPREVAETGHASMFSWLHLEMAERMMERGYAHEADHLKLLWSRQAERLCERVKSATFVQTEHYFDNAGIAVTAENLLNSGEIVTGLEAARLLLPNVAPSNDYRSFAPDRWWEALACMYHNLWAAFPAKAMLTAYEKSRDNRYLFAAYRSMMPMFYNYDWTAVSALNHLIEGEGASAYCLTSPNLNVEYASRNRFGQSIFKDEFFNGIDVAGDDWDLGADMIAYLYTFGQKAYVTICDGKLVCVNGELEGTLQEMRVQSFAAYPAQYYFEPLDMTISRGSTEFVIAAVTIHNEQCERVEVRRLTQGCAIDVICTRAGQAQQISPEVIYL